MLSYNRGVNNEMSIYSLTEEESWIKTYIYNIEDYTIIKTIVHMCNMFNLDENSIKDNLPNLLYYAKEVKSPC